MDKKITNTAFATAVALLLAALPFSAPAGTIERLLMPGPVIEGHAEYEDECSRCHLSFRKASQTDLCLECHEFVRKDVLEETGFHGTLRGAEQIECRGCHTEHEGRDADVVKLNPSGFDHAKTDFPLEGGHVALSCPLCHHAEKKHREAPHECIECHREKDPHKERLGKSCEKCHNEKSWGENSFDHDKTEFVLLDSHEKVACDACHPGAHYKPTPTRCSVCHALDDVHRERNGEKCDKCHNEKEWKETRFDHGKDTDYSLKGKHKSLDCIACHKNNAYKEKLKTGCADCHRRDDPHLGRYGEKCDTCHGEEEWKELLFEHDRDTEYKLMGKHKEVLCDGCHPARLYEDKAPVLCSECHKEEDVHGGQQGDRCNKCHDTSGWRANLIFDHDLSRFPLLGMHAMVSCEECHLSGVYKDVQLNCLDCHEKDDSHEGALGEQCAACHNPNDWALWQFDHDEEATKFLLTGAHAELGCPRCHKHKDKKRERPRICNNCHSRDDDHRGRFGFRCENCHGTESWEEVNFR